MPVYARPGNSTDADHSSEFTVQVAVIEDDIVSGDSSANRPMSKHSIR